MRCLLVWTAATAVLAVPAPWLLGQASRGATALHGSSTEPAAVQRALVGLAAAALLGCAAWAWVALSAVVLEALRATDACAVSPAGAPALCRRAVLSACGVALTGASLYPAYADPGAHGDRRPQVAARIVGLPLPELVPTVPNASPHRPGTALVVVAAGDSLWSIAERDLPPGSSSAAVAARWHTIYAANRALIGPDPDLITPGTHLRLPGRESP